MIGKTSIEITCRSYHCFIDTYCKSSSVLALILDVRFFKAKTLLLVNYFQEQADY